jgi:uncharacterized secreted protein with C-terminal beta-propeller domain
MDEYEGHLRIATTTGHLTFSDLHNTVSILEDQGDGLVLVGTVDDIAPREDIRSVRFDGDRGFVVTFEKTDPLFALDLSDPKNPILKGELVIPGFSTYIHPMDENHLLTIGYGGDDQGSFSWFEGIMLQTFDISHMTSPKLEHKVVIGTRGSTSDAATNHLAFNYFKPKDLLAIPMVICEGGSGGYYGDIMTFSGLMVYRITTEEGFEYLGGVSHGAPETTDTWRGACNNWWTDPNSKVKRSIFMDEVVFSITLDEIKVNKTDELGQDLVVIPLTQ